MDHVNKKLQFTTKLIFKKFKTNWILKRFVLAFIKVKLFSEESNLIYYINHYQHYLFINIRANCSMNKIR